MKKNLICLFAVVAVVLALMLSLPVCAAGSASVDVRLTGGTASIGSELTFTVSVSNAAGVKGIAVIPTCGTGLKLTGGNWLVSGKLEDFSVQEGNAVIAFNDATELDRDILTFTLEVTDDAVVGSRTEVACEVVLNDGSNATYTCSCSITIICEHSFTARSTDAKYLKSAATCTARATYYYSCTKCGAAGTDTFEDGELLPHTYDRKNTTDTYLKDAATCTAPAVYYYSCTCGDRGTTTFEDGSALGHAFATVWSSDDSSHWHKCSRCDEKRDEAAHNYDQKITTEAYLKSAATCTAKATYYYSCTCGKKGTATFENGDVLPHTYDQKNTADTYLKSAATCTTRAVYYYSCTCGEKGTTTFESGDMQAHDYVKAWVSDASEHWYTCTNCTTHLESAAHVYDNACDTTCNVCGHVRETTHSYMTTWTTGSTEHWHACSACGDKKDIEAHIPGAEATTTTPQTCTVCGYVITPAIGHTHSYGTEWVKDETTHYHECSCGAKSESAVHTPGDWIIDKEATVGAAGAKHKECTVCGQTVETATIAALPDPTVDTTTVPTPDTTPAPTVDTTTVPAPDTTPAPTVDTTTVPTTDTTPAPTVDTTTVPTTDTTPAPTVDTTTVPTTEDTTTAPSATTTTGGNGNATGSSCGGFGGCGSLVALGVLAALIPAAAIILKRKED